MTATRAVAAVALAASVAALEASGSPADATAVTSPFDDPGIVAPPPRFGGSVDSPPLAHFSVPLPGGRVGSGAHSERSRPTVWGDVVLVGSAAGRALYALSRRNGSLIRAYPTDGAVESGVTVVGSDVVFCDSAGTTWRYALDGTLRWRRPGTAPILVEPTVSGDFVYVADVEDLVVALRLSDGELAWRYQRPPDVGRTGSLALFAAPPPVVDGDVVYVGFSDGALVAIEAETGDEAWSVDVGEGDYPDLVAAPVRVGGDLLVSGYFAPFAAVDFETNAIRWRVDAGSALPPLLWEREAGLAAWHAGTDGVLRGVDVRTGDVFAEVDVGAGSALTGLEGTPAGLLVASGRGALALVAPEAATVVWRHRAERRFDGITAAPTIAGRQVLLTTNGGRLVSLLAAPPSDPVPTARYPGDPEARPW